MGREIKFRAWDKVEKEMMLPARWEEDFIGCSHKKIGLYIFRSKKDPRQHSSLDWVLRHPESFEIMQFTGLLDKNGKKIYEGDIVKFDNNKFGSVVKWNDKGFYQLWRNGTVDWKIWKEDAYYNTGHRKDLKVVGNIHENANLIQNVSSVQ